MAKDNAITLTTEQQALLNKLTKLQKGVALNTIKGMAPTESHKKAGGKCKNEKQRKDLAAQILSIPRVKEFIQSINKGVAEEAMVDATYVLNRLVEIDKMDVIDILQDDGSIKPITEWPSVWRRYLSGIELAEMFEYRDDQKELVGMLKKIKWPDKIKNLELLGKHKAINAFKHVVEHNAGEGVTFNMQFGSAKDGD